MSQKLSDNLIMNILSYLPITKSLFLLNRKLNILYSSSLNSNEVFLISIQNKNLNKINQMISNSKISLTTLFHCLYLTYEPQNINIKLF